MINQPSLPISDHARLFRIWMSEVIWPDTSYFLLIIEGHKQTRRMALNVLYGKGVSCNEHPIRAADGARHFEYLMMPGKRAVERVSRAPV